MGITLSDLRLRSRQKADRENSNFVEDDELNYMINGSIAELHDLLVMANHADYAVSEYDFTTTANTSEYVLPADFYKLKGVDAQPTTGHWISLRPFNFNERNRTLDAAWGVLNVPAVRYRLLGNNVKFSPTPDANINMKLWYTPKATVLVDDTDEFDDLNGFSEYVIVDVAIKYLLKEEGDVSALMQQKEMLKRRIEVMANNRDEGHPQTVSDIYAENNDFWLSRGD